MKVLAFVALVITLFVSLFQISGANLSNNVLAVAVMILLLVLFADLKEFNFWGLWGKKREEPIKKIEEGEVILSKQKPSRYKLTKAEKEDDPQQMGSDIGNFLSVSYEIERLLRIIARSISTSGKDVAFTPDASLKTLVDSGFLSNSAVEAIELIRDVRIGYLQSNLEVNSTYVLYLRQVLEVATDVHQQLKRWIEDPKKIDNSFHGDVGSEY